MKKLLSILTLLVTLSFCVSVNAEVPTFFENKEGCLTALASGQFTPYTTRAKWHGKKIEGEVKPLEASACVDAEVVGGRKWVVVPAGFKLRWDNNKPVAMEDCGGNPVYSVAYLPPPTTHTLVGLPKDDLVVDNRTFVDNSDHSTNIWVDRSNNAPPPTTGWCGIIHTNAGCNWATGGLVVVGAVIAIASGGGGSSEKKSNGGETGPATRRFVLRVGTTF